MSNPVDAKPGESPPSEPAESAMLKHLAGSAILTVAGYAAGAGYGTVAKTGIKSSAAVGAGIGLLSSLGFGKQVYNGISAPFRQGEKTQVERLKERSSTDKGCER